MRRPPGARGDWPSGRPSPRRRTWSRGPQPPEGDGQSGQATFAHEEHAVSLILVVEDETAIAELIAINLRHAGFQVAVAADADTAQSAVDRILPDLVLLDWMLPGQSGVQLARRWRADARTRDLPLIMLTARAEESDKITGLDAGADDYLTKPFSTKELLARIRAVLRRKAPEALDTAVEVSGLRLDPATRRVTRRVADEFDSDRRRRKCHCGVDRDQPAPRGLRGGGGCRCRHGAEGNRPDPA